jgi:hypothetical protein
MTPAGHAAAALNLNRKTVARHYHLLREGIGIICGEGKGPSCRGAPPERTPQRILVREVPAAILAFEGGRVRVILNPDGERHLGSDGLDSALVYARSGQALAKVDLGDFLIFLTGPEDGPEQAGEILKFWRFTKRLGLLYRGRNREDFALFMREAEFRFNQRDNPEVVSTLFDILKGGVAGRRREPRGEASLEGF